MPGSERVAHVRNRRTDRGGQAARCRSYRRQKTWITGQGQEIVNPANTVERWARLRGWGGAYEIELASGRVRSRDRTVVDALGRVRRLRGVELAPQSPVRGGGPRVCLCVKGYRRTMPICELLRQANG